MYLGPSRSYGDHSELRMKTSVPSLDSVLSPDTVPSLDAFPH